MSTQSVQLTIDQTARVEVEYDSYLVFWPNRPIYKQLIFYFSLVKKPIGHLTTEYHYVVIQSLQIYFLHLPSACVVCRILLHMTDPQMLCGAS